MNWTLAIERNREALLRIVAALFAMAGLDDTGTVATLPRHMRNTVLRILRPAESAVRRLIVIAARDLEVVLRPSGERGKTRPDARRETSRPGTGVVPALPLLDPRKCFSFKPPKRRPKAFPRITFIGLSDPTPIPENWIPSPDDLLDTQPLCRRLSALKRALDDLDGQAKRLARWRARRDLALVSLRGEVASAAKPKGANRKNYRFSPMRPGWPPGHRKRHVHEIDAVLRECHVLALSLERAGPS